MNDSRLPHATLMGLACRHRRLRRPELGNASLTARPKVGTSGRRPGGDGPFASRAFSGVRLNSAEQRRTPRQPRPPADGGRRATWRVGAHRKRITGYGRGAWPPSFTHPDPEEMTRNI